MIIHALIDIFLVLAIIITHFIFMNKNNRPNASVVETALYSSIGLSASIFYYFQINADFVFINIIIVIMVRFYKGFFHALISIVPNTIFVFLAEQITVFLIVGAIASFAVLLVITMISKVFSERSNIYKFRLWVGIGLYLSAILITTIWWLVIGNTFTFQLFIYHYYPIAIIIVLLFISIYLERLVNSMLKLYDSSNYIFEFFFKSGLTQRKLNQYIKDNSAKYGIVVLYTINDKSLNYEELEQRFKAINSFVANAFKGEGVLFQTDTFTFGFFIPRPKLIDTFMSIQGNKRVNRITIDPLYSVEKTLKEALKQDPFKSELISSAFFYGCQASDVVTGLKMAEDVLNNPSLREQNIVTLFNPEKFIEMSWRHKAIEKLNSFVNVNNIDNNYLNIYDSKNNKSKFFLAEPSTSDKYKTFEDVKRFAKVNNIDNEFYRYTAALAIKSFSGFERTEKLAIFYKARYIASSDFDIYSFMSNLESFGIDAKRLLLVLNSKSIYIRSKLFQSNINKLKRAGVRFIFYNVDENTNFKYFKLVTPFAIFIDEKLYNTKNINYNLKEFVNRIKKNTRALIIANRINSMLALKTIKNSDIQYYGGRIFEKDNKIPTKLNVNFMQYSKEVEGRR